MPMAFAASSNKPCPFANSSEVVMVGEVPNTNAPLPVSFVTVAARLADVGVARKVAIPLARPLTPVLIGSPVQLVKVPALGVPMSGVVSAGLVASTLFPVPVDVFQLTSVPSLLSTVLA